MLGHFELLLRVRRQLLGEVSAEVSDRSVKYPFHQCVSVLRLLILKRKSLACTVFFQVEHTRKRARNENGVAREREEFV